MTKKELGELIINSEDSFYRVARSLLYNDADCADAISEMIVKAFDKLYTLKNDSYAKTWLTRILITECFAIMRKEKKIVSIETIPEGSHNPAPEEFQDLYDSMERLPEKMRLSVTLYYMEGYSMKEIAKMLNETELAVKTRMSRARKKLKQDLEGEVL